MDLPLLDWQPSAQVFVFPLERRAGKIRRVVDLLGRKHGADAEGYWRTIVRSLAEQMARAGISETTIDQELRVFSHAVQFELSRRRNAGFSPTGDDAA